MSAEQERAGDVDEQGAGGERAAGQPLERPPTQIAADAADRAPDRDVPEHAGRYTFPLVLRLAIAQLRPRKGAYEENLGRLGEVFREVGGVGRSRPS